MPVELSRRFEVFVEGNGLASLGKACGRSAVCPWGGVRGGVYSSGVVGALKDFGGVHGCIWEVGLSSGK